MKVQTGRLLTKEKAFGRSVSVSQLYDFTLVVFLSFNALNFFLRTTLRPFGMGSSSRMVGLVFLCVPMVIIAFLQKGFLTDFWLIWGSIVLFFLLTYLFHPEYEEWYTRKEYGVLDYVISPENGLYIYLLLRRINDPKRILHCIKMSAIPMYLYFLIQITSALKRGYWIDTSNRGYELHLNYNLSLGYTALIFALTFLYCALEYKKMRDWIGAGAGILIILLAGSRGPMLDIFIFLVIYFLIKVGISKKKIAIIVAVTLSGMLLYLALPYILEGVSAILQKLSISSRFLNKLLDGTLSDDSGRLVIWKAAINMIKAKPLGYGAMGSRHVISQFIYVAHPHNFFLEVLIDFGVVVGGSILAWLFYWVVRLFRMENTGQWKGLFLIFFARACQLLLSLTFWHSIGLWGTLAIGVCMWKESKKKRGIAR